MDEELSQRLDAVEDDIVGIDLLFNQTGGTHSVCTICPVGQYSKHLAPYGYARIFFFFLFVLCALFLWALFLCLLLCNVCTTGHSALGRYGYTWSSLFVTKTELTLHTAHSASCTCCGVAPLAIVSVQFCQCTAFGWDAFQQLSAELKYTLWKSPNPSIVCGSVCSGTLISLLVTMDFWLICAQTVVQECSGHTGTICSPCPNGTYSMGGFARECLDCSLQLDDCEYVRCRSSVVPYSMTSTYNMCEASFKKYKYVLYCLSCDVYVLELLTSDVWYRNHKLPQYITQQEQHHTPYYGN